MFLDKCVVKIGSINMSVTLNSQNTVFSNMRNHSVQNSPSFRASEPEQAPIQAQAQDEVVTQEPKKKKSLIRKFKDGYASFKKGLITAGEYAKSTVKGVFFGGIAAGGVLGADAIMGATKIIKNAKAGEAIDKAVKVLSTKGKVLAGIAGVAVLGYNLFQASLNASEKKAEVDHRWGTSHNG